MRAARIAARLRDYDWIAALFELLIVVVGILIALQVSNWNQDRQDRARAASYSARIHADLRADLRNMDATLAYWRKVSDYGHLAIANGETDALAGGSNWNTVLAYYQASQVMPFVQTDGSYTEMRAVGDLKLIADMRLRDRLETYYSLSGVGEGSIIHNQSPAYREQVRGLTPWPVQQYVWSHCVSESSYLEQHLVDCPSPIGDAEAADILARYRQSPSLLANLRSWMSTLRVSELVLANERREAAALAAATDGLVRR